MGRQAWVSKKERKDSRYGGRVSQEIEIVTCKPCLWKREERHWAA